ncbi:asparagine synthetase B [Salipaludibacillus keqinensis]|uniref:asparagine synthase (glutamine-hydrolyzing) n=1 Tax=Salipaludibacillus keqinensis TaxID=2045207 RepID=A0A323TKY7_9BACI|nr:asparagine synthase-related protein [Salipaludibacillus keqinensis]PYZ94644.1 asparagine synthetase B [Salipaludibacillus keqinensis]
MSAIVGILNTNKIPVPTVQSKNMMLSLHHYPSDVVHAWHKESIFMGCLNQWITPEQIGEQLPYYDYEKQYVITADAIIDNRPELFSMLQVKRIDQQEMTDARLILLAYEKWGEESVKHLIGDFAFMIWDERKQKLFGARDFSGARTLYYFNDFNRFVFSTTIAPMFTLPYIKKELNEDWLAQFIAIPSMVEAADMQATVYKTVEQVPPSHTITVLDGKVKLTRYITIDVRDKLKLKSNEEYEEAFREVFQRAVVDRTRTYGEVGSHLSGGLDSGTVVSFAAKELLKEGKTLHTFSYVPEEDFKDWTPSYYQPDESPLIKKTIAHVGNIDPEYMRFEGKTPLAEVDDMLGIMEMPYKFFENTFWLKGINEEANRKGIKMLLNGARGNHSISWGSLNLTYSYYESLMKKLMWVQLFRELDSYCINFRAGKSDVVPFIAKRVMKSFSWQTNSDYHFPKFVNTSLARRTDVFAKLNDYGIDISGNFSGNLSQYRKKYFKDLSAWNKSGVVGTKMSLRYSLWDRDPSNDLRVIKFCLSLPEEQYVTEGLGRSIIRRATINILPDQVRLNQRSRGIQGADVIHRMSKQWRGFKDELCKMSNDVRMADLLNIDLVKTALSKMDDQPRPDLIFEDEFKMLTRSLIIYRFLEKSAERG